MGKGSVFKKLKRSYYQLIINRQTKHIKNEKEHNHPNNCCFNFYSFRFVLVGSRYFFILNIMYRLFYITISNQAYYSKKGNKKYFNFYRDPNYHNKYKSICF